MQKTQVKVMHRKIVFVKVESSVIKYLKVTIDLDAVTLLGLLASESVFLVSRRTVNQTASCQHTLSVKTTAAHWRGTVVLESK